MKTPEKYEFGDYSHEDFEVKKELEPFVHLVFHKIEKIDFVVKSIEIPPKTDYNRHKIEAILFSEKNAGQYSQHQNLNGLLGIFCKDHIAGLVYNYADQGNLNSYLENSKKTSTREQEALVVFWQILEGLHAFHQQGFLHRDIKPKNILVFSHPTDATKPIFKLADFGEAKLFGVAETKNIGTPAYRAPEVCVDDPTFKYGPKADYWSLGIVFYEMLFGVLPWNKDGKIKENEINKIVRAFDIKSHNYLTIISSEAKRMLEGLLEQDPEKRLDYWGIRNLKIYQIHNPNNKLEPLIDVVEMEKQEDYDKIEYIKYWAKNKTEKILSRTTQIEYGIFPYDLQNVSEDCLFEAVDLCRKEIIISKDYNHKNVTPLHNFYYSKNKNCLNLLYPYGVNALRLSERLLVEDKLPIDVCIFAIIDLIEGINFIHERGWSHYEIRPENVNISLASDGKLLFSLVGYGLSNEAQNILATSEPSAIIYQSPEYVSKGQKGCTYRSDYWSLGVLFYEMIKGTIVGIQTNNKERIELISDKILSLKIDEDGDIPSEAKELLKGLLVTDPSERKTYNDIKNMQIWKIYTKNQKPAEEKKEMEFVQTDCPDMQQNTNDEADR